MENDRQQRRRARVVRPEGKEGLEGRLLTLIERTGYAMVQENGQRRYGGPPPNWQGLPPPPSAELYVSRIPPHCFEDVLVPLFEKHGPIYEARLMLDFDGAHRGFAYVKFCNPEHANSAAAALDHFQVNGSGGRGIRVCASRNNCEVEVSNLPWTGVRERLEPLVWAKTDGVKAVRWTCATRATLEYENHRAAAVARRTLLSLLPDECGREVRVQLLRREQPESDPRPQHGHPARRFQPPQPSQPSRQLQQPMQQQQQQQVYIKRIS